MSDFNILGLYNCGPNMFGMDFSPIRQILRIFVKPSNKHEVIEAFFEEKSSRFSFRVDQRFDSMFTKPYKVLSSI